MKGNPLGFENINKGKHSYKDYLREAYPQRFMAERIKEEKKGRKLDIM